MAAGYPDRTVLVYDLLLPDPASRVYNGGHFFVSPDTHRVVQLTHGVDFEAYPDFRVAWRDSRGRPQERSVVDDLLLATVPLGKKLDTRRSRYSNISHTRVVVPDARTFMTELCQAAHRFFYADVREVDHRLKSFYDELALTNHARFEYCVAAGRVAAASP